MVRSSISLEIYKALILLCRRDFGGNTAHPSLQALSRALTQVDYLLPGGMEQLRNRYVVQRQLVPQLEELDERKL